MRRLLAVRFFVGVLAVGIPAAAEAATVSGQLVHSSDNTPAAGITVTLANGGGRSQPVKSDEKGSYSFSNIPAGQYYLEVWVNPTTPQSYTVTVSEPSTTLQTEKVP
jgi:hypothetical protein